MYKTLRIFFTCISVALVASAIFIFVYFGLWGFIVVAGAFCSFMLAKLFKRKQEEKEEKDNPSPLTGDFITGRVQLPGTSESTASEEYSDAEEQHLSENLTSTPGQTTGENE